MNNLEKCWKIMEEYNLPEDTEEVVYNSLISCEQHGVEVNAKVWQTKLLRHLRKNKISSKLLSVVHLFYQKKNLNTAFYKLEINASSAVRSLKSVGFEFKDSEASNGLRWVFSEGGIQCREITGFSFKKPELTPRNKASSEAKKSFLSSKRCPLSHRSGGLEIDHRKPIMASALDDEKPVILTDDLIYSGEADRHFQVLSRETNSLKRECCKKCLNGQEIEYPRVLRDSAKDAKQYRNGKCEDCPWYNLS
jgi:hypothetical protein